MAKLAVLVSAVVAAVLATAVSGSTHTDILFFPDPLNEGRLIPAFIGSQSRTSGTFRPKEEEDYETQAHFYLITSRNPSINDADELFIGDVEALTKSRYIPGAPLKIMAHGFGGNWRAGFPTQVASELLAQGQDMNLILIDWSSLATSPWYNIAAPATKGVGRSAGMLVQTIIDHGWTSYDMIHIIGYSLGAHVAGSCGATLGGKAARITALDPALPLFDLVSDEDRIDPDDAVFVDVLHTAGGYLWNNGLAFMTPRGDVDFYPNSGTRQPGCQLPDDTFGGCSHGRAPAYYKESIAKSSGFPACKCETWEDFVGEVCDCSDVQVMGFHTPSSARGLYYLNTTSASPFDLGLGGIKHQ